MTEQILTPVLITFFTALVTWFFTRKIKKLDLGSKNTDNEIKSSKYYQGLLDDFSKRLDSAIDELMELEIRHRELMSTNRKLVDELLKFKQLNGKSKE